MFHEEDREAESCATRMSLAQTGPIVGDENGIDWVRRIVFDAGGLAGNQTFEAHLAFQAGDVLRGVIGDAGDGVAVGDELARAIDCRRLGLAAKNSAWSGAWFCGVFGEFDHLAFGDATNLIEVQTAAAFSFFRIDCRAKKGIGDHRDCGECCAGDGGESFPISEQALQRSDPRELSLGKTAERKQQSLRNLRCSERQSQEHLF